MYSTRKSSGEQPVEHPGQIRADRNRAILFGTSWDRNFRDEHRSAGPESSGQIADVQPHVKVREEGARVELAQICQGDVIGANCTFFWYSAVLPATL